MAIAFGTRVHVHDVELRPLFPLIRWELLFFLIRPEICHLTHNDDSSRLVHSAWAFLSMEFSGTLA